MQAKSRREGAKSIGEEGAAQRRRKKFGCSKTRRQKILKMAIEAII
jgi:hypothetical protein